MSSTSNNERHFEEEEWDDNQDTVDPLVDNGEPGVKVRALYDYEAAESDELDFKAGRFCLLFVLPALYFQHKILTKMENTIKIFMK